MKIGGHGLGEHIRLLAPVFVFVGAVWLLRLILGALGATGALVHAVSVTGAASLAVLIAVVLMYVRRFGSYYNVVVATFLIVAWGQLLIVMAIAFSVLTGVENVFTRPEYSIPVDDPYHLRHIMGHLTFALGSGILFGVGTGCLLLLLLKKLLPQQRMESSGLNPRKNS